MQQSTLNDLNNARHYQHFYKGLKFNSAQTVVSFSIPLPKYMHFLMPHICTYNGWKITLHKNPHTIFLQAWKSVPSPSALSEGIYMRSEILKACRLFSPRKPRRRDTVKDLTFAHIHTRLYNHEKRNEPLSSSHHITGTEQHERDTYYDNNLH